MRYQDIQQKIRPIFESDPEIAAVYLFGSTATGKNHLKSDIDLAILFQRPLSTIESHRRLEQHFVKLTKALGAEPDLVDLEKIDLILLFEILKEGIILIENDRERNRNFMGRKLVECIDFQTIMKRCARGMYRNALERVSG
ncbi:MAG: nucleotidyltransferase domain-containing protein [candidate division KSB1 bacterium]|nr:nucleotidyltransferase domain-containing protein [candidate division KSB1 bacterium]MDZ7399582.1 nucleotidyltransferase domain-containing protein [candidate division KSB1 bacterium]